MKNAKLVKPKRRNLLHDAPYLRKCSVHDQSSKSKRRKLKVDLKKEWSSQ
jgi:hypothetical protein